MGRRYYNWMLAIVSIAFSTYMFYAAIYGPYKTTLAHLAIFFAVMFSIYFCDKGIKSDGRISRYSAFGFAALSVFAGGYIVVEIDRIIGLLGAPFMTDTQLIVGSLLVLCVLEAARRENKPFFILSLLGMGYTFFGPYFPSFLTHPGIDPKRFVYLTAYTEEGVFGLGLTAASSYLFMFMLFSTTMNGTRLSEVIANICGALVGHKVGGPAKTAMLASATLGTVTGSSIGNVLSSGAFTIPLMKRYGFKPHTAAAVEVVSSEGAQLVPPVMGAAAFLMAEMTGIPYASITLAAVIPAILYFVSAYFVIHVEALRIRREEGVEIETPPLLTTLKGGFHLLLAPAVLFYFILVEGYSPMYSGVLAIITALVVAQLRPGMRMSPGQIVDVFRDGVVQAAHVTALIAAVGLIQQALVTTGLAPKLTDLILFVGADSMLLTCFVAFVLATVLGAGMPTPIVYIILAVFVAPAMVTAGVPTLAAHMFLFYFAIKSGSTPPVAVVAIVAAGIANANWWKTGVTAFVFAFPGSIVAVMFVYSPGLLFQGGPLTIAWAFLTAGVGVIATAAAVQGWLWRWLNVWQRLLCFAAGVCLVAPNLLMTAAGAAALAIVLFTLRAGGSRILPAYKDNG